MTHLNDRQCWLLIYLLSRYPSGISETSRVPYSCDLNGKNYGCPGGIGMLNIRGLQKRGYVKALGNGLYALTENGVIVAQNAADDPRWVSRNS